MKHIVDILIFGLQVILAIVTAVFIYMIFALLDYDGGFDSFIGFTIFQPIIGLVVSSIIVFLCLVIGLPIRLIRKLNQWWTKNFYLAYLLTLIGLLLLFIATLPQFLELKTVMFEGEERIKMIPHFGFALSGWFLICFSILHSYPSNILRMKTQETISQLIGN